MLKIAEYGNRISELKDKAIVALSKSDMDFPIQDRRDKPIRLVFCGQYSAGKSSILKMLTGNPDIKIGAGITTEKIHTYEWNGLELMDTPGIHTTLRPDHDDDSYDAIASADLLVFVVTNELFDSYIADHFRKLAIDKDKAGEMILVVNKMGRTGNTVDYQITIEEDLRKVVAPYTPEQLYLSFLDAQSYLNSIKYQDDDPEYAAELFEDSGYEAFIEKLNQFIKSKGIASKLTTDLYVLEDCLEKAIQDLQPKSADTDIDALEESFLQQKYLFIEERGRMQQEVQDIYTTAASRIRDYGLEAANSLVEGCTQEKVEDELQKYIRLSDEIIEQCQKDAVDVIESRLCAMGVKLDEIEDSHFSKVLKPRLSGIFGGLPENTKQILLNASQGFQKAGKAIVENAFKEGVEGGLKLTNFSGSTIHKMVLKTKDFLKLKFKPWQALKITKGIAIGGQMLSALGVGLSVFMQIKTDQDEERIRKELKKNRQNIRSMFNETANELEAFSYRFIQNSVQRPLAESISVLDDSIQEIRDSRTDRSATCRALEGLQRECRILVQEIHTDIILK